MSLSISRLLSVLLLVTSVMAIDEFTVPLPRNLVVFPKDFRFGVSTSAYQIEGGWLEDDKGFSIWDVLSHTGQLSDTGDVAIDFYHKFESDLALMASFSIRHFRMSIAWTRLLPDGTTTKISQAGIDFYNRVFDACDKYNITPFVTLFHSDVPANLVQYPRSGLVFLSPDFPDLFTNYADVVFKSFGNRIKDWSTFNEPWCSAVLGAVGDVDVYRAAHNILLAHAKTVNLYRTKYQPTQHGKITIVLNTAHFYPATNTPADIAAVQRTFDFNFGWFSDVLVNGDYPASMRATCKDRLPTFTAIERALLRGSVDSIAINHYMPFLCKAGGHDDGEQGSYWKDINTTCYNSDEWPVNCFGWGVYAPGLRDLLMYVTKRYPAYPIIIAENGMCAPGEDNKTVALNDVTRQQYIRDYIENAGEAIAMGAKLTGYYVWSILDNLEWGSGFDKHFGMVWVDRSDPHLTRYPKSSLALYKKIIESTRTN